MPLSRLLAPNPTPILCPGDAHHNLFGVEIFFTWAAHPLVQNSFSFFSSLFPLPPSSGSWLLPLPSCMDVPPSIFFHIQHLLILPDWLSQQPSTALSASLSLLQQKLLPQGCNVTNHPKTMASNNHHALLLMCLWGGWVVVRVVAELVGVSFGIRLELIKRLMVS